MLPLDFIAGVAGGGEVLGLLGALSFLFILLGTVYTEGRFEDEGIILPIYPSSNNGTQYTGTIDMMRFNRAIFYCITGTIGSLSNVAFQVQQSNNSNGSTNTNVTNAQVTINASSQIATVELRADNLTARYIQCKAVVNTNASTDACVPVGCEARQHPQNMDDASVTARVIV